MNTQNHPDTTKLKGKIAVMQAAEDGEKIDMRFRVGCNWARAQTNELPWDWSCYDYRIAPSPIAPGHNPTGLTVNQVPNGRRLMTEEEVRRAETKGRIPKGEIWWWFAGKWDEGWYLMNGDDLQYTYCVPIDWVDPLLPKPKRRVPWSCPEDVPGPVCWVKHPTWCDGECGLLIGLLNEGVYVGGGRELDNRFREWEWFGRHSILHSTDRKTWLPCEKEVEG